MARWSLILLAGVILATAVPLSAETVREFQDDVYLRDHETVRYGIDIDFGIGPDATIDVLVRGFDGPPRVRILDGNRHEMKETRDTDGDWTINPSVTARFPDTHYSVEVDSALPGRAGDFEVSITVYAPTGNNADADIHFDKYFRDYESGDASDHYKCSVSPDAGSWPLVLLALTALSVLYFRRREKPARVRVSRKPTKKPRHDE